MNLQPWIEAIAVLPTKPSCHNPLIKGAKVCSLFPVGAFAFSNEIPTFPNFLRAIESQTNLKESIRVEARAKHYAILAYKKEDILMIQFTIEEKGNLIANQLKSSCIWRVNHDVHLWRIKIRLPFQVLENEWIYNLFNGEDCLLSLNLKEVVQVSEDCIIIFYKFTPLSLVWLIAKTKEFIWINSLVKAKCFIWTPTKPYHLLVEYPLCGVNHPTSLTCTVEIIQKQEEDAISKLFEEEQQSFSLKKDQIMITNVKKYEEMKFIYEKETPTEEQVPKEKDEIAEMEREEEGMSKGFETQSKNEQEKRKVNE